MPLLRHHISYIKYLLQYPLPPLNLLSCCILHQSDVKGYDKNQIQAEYSIWRLTRSYIFLKIHENQRRYHKNYNNTKSSLCAETIHYYRAEKRSNAPPDPAKDSVDSHISGGLLRRRHPPENEVPKVPATKVGMCALSTCIRGKSGSASRSPNSKME